MYRDISVDELAEWQNSGKAFTLLDVREPAERDTASIPGSVHIPIGEIAGRAGELDKHGEIAVFCHLGGRSARVAQFLSAQGFRSVFNVDGGIDEYAQRIDPSIKRY